MAELRTSLRRLVPGREVEWFVWWFLATFYVGGFLGFTLLIDGSMGFSLLGALLVTAAGWLVFAAPAILSALMGIGSAPPVDASDRASLGAMGAVIGCLVGVFTALPMPYMVWWVDQATGGGILVGFVLAFALLCSVAAILSGSAVRITLALGILHPRRYAYRCAQCNYDLRGNPRSGVCPECGVRVATPEVGGGDG